MDERQLGHPIPKAADFGALLAAEAPYEIPCSSSQRTSVDLQLECSFTRIWLLDVPKLISTCDFNTQSCSRVGQTAEENASRWWFVFACLTVRNL